MTKWLGILATLLITTTAHPAAVIFSGDDVKALKSNLNLADTAKILTDTDDPTSIAKSAPIGSILMNQTNGQIYRKLDAGSTTNWQVIGSSAQGRFNMVTNPDFNVNIDDWTNSGSGTFVRITSGTAFNSAGAGEWDAAVAADKLDSDAFTVPEGLRGRDCEIEMYVKGGGTADITVRVEDGSANELISIVLTAAESNYRKLDLNFVCPTSGTVNVELEAAGNAATLQIENVFLGETNNLGVIDGAEFVGAVNWTQTVNCQWTSSVTTFADFSVDADCTTPTGSDLEGTAIAPATKVPGIRFNSLAPGRYVFVATGHFRTSGADSVDALRFDDGTNSSKEVQIYHAATTATAYPEIRGEITYLTAQGDTTIQIQPQAELGTSTIDIFAGTANNNTPLYISVYRFPLESQKALKIETSNWYVDVNIGGANPSLGTSAVSAYTELTDTGLDLVINEGSVTDVQIACISGTVSEGLTCNVAAVAESVGVTFLPPRTGTYEACFHFAHAAGCGGGTCVVTPTFQMVQTTDASSAIVKEGNTRMSKRDEADASDSNSSGQPNCGLFVVDSIASRIAVRLEYEQVVGGTVGSSLIQADRAAGDGQHDIHVTVRPWTQVLPMPVIVDTFSTTTGGNTSYRKEWVRVDADCTTNPCTVAESSPGIGLVDRDGVGDYSINFSPAFSVIHKCDVSILDSAGGLIPRVNAMAVGAVDLQTFSDATPTASDTGFMVECTGVK